MERKCSRCGNNRGRKERYCLKCHAAYMRKWRKTHPLTEEQRLKDNARSYANVYLKRGKLVKKPCRVCNSPKVQMHHEDYTKPLEVDWLCSPHHKEADAVAAKKRGGPTHEI